MARVRERRGRGIFCVASRLLWSVVFRCVLLPMTNQRMDPSSGRQRMTMIQMSLLTGGREDCRTVMMAQM